jgi:TRAP-type transport system small permease protein
MEGAGMSQPDEISGQAFQAEEENIDLRRYKFEDWLSAVIFWLLAAVVFTQFFTRYVLNDSASWTEEIARYLLIGVVFIGAAIGVRRNNHIQVDFAYRYMPKRAARVMATLVDVARVAFFLTACGLTVQLISRIGSSRMAVIDLPMGLVYSVVLLGFALMSWRAMVLTLNNWRAGRSTLEDQEIQA